VTFNGGSRQAVIAAGAQITSDPVAMAVHAGETISVSIAVSGWAGVSAHTCCDGFTDTWATSNGVGNLTTSPSGANFNALLTKPYIRWLSGISVAGSPAIGSIVAFGDSITDGYGYMNNGFSWVTAIQKRISQLPTNEQVSVVNEGIAGNTMAAFPPGTTYEESSGGLAGVKRFNNDALAWPGVKDVLLLLGTNDIWFGAGGMGKPVPPYGTPLSIEGAMRQVIAQAHAKGVKIYGITLLPRSTSTAADHDQPEYWGPQEQAILHAVNTWMLSGTTGFDGVIDLAAVMGDVYNGACTPTVPYAPYFNPDHLHPNVAGETAMGNAISTALFGLPQAPQIPPLVSVTPTSNCAAAQAATAILAASTAPGTTTTTSTTTTTVPATTTTKPPVSLLSRVDSSGYLWAALALTILLALLGARRRQLRQKAEARRRAVRLADFSRRPPPTPPRRSPPPGPPPRRPPPRR
jgi:lysophospholipase L1-like esterase